VEQSRFLNQYSVCGGIHCCYICIVHAPVLSIKSESKFGKNTFIFLYYGIDSVKYNYFYFCRPCCYCFWEIKIYTLSVFRRYMLTFLVGEPMKICVIRNIYIYIFTISLINLIKHVYYKTKYQNYIPLPVRFYQPTIHDSSTNRILVLV
jgi:hypothetical protein